MSEPRVSVIIATYNRAAHLDECLGRLRRQRFRPGDEVIVVDNGSTDETGQVVARHQAVWTAPLQLLHEARPGKSHAIARALGAVSGDVLAFTDDDVNVGDAWLDAIRVAMSDPAVALAGGPVAGRWESTVPSWFRRACARHPRLGAPVGLLDYGSRGVDLGPRTLLGANLAVRREAFTAAGGFAPHLGKLRGTLLSGEDHELCRWVQASGRRAIYEPRAVVHHWVPTHRARLGYVLQWFFWSGITHGIMDMDMTAPVRGVCGVPFYIVRRAAMASVGVLTALATGRWPIALDRAIDVAFSAGYTAERLGLAKPTHPAPPAAREVA